MDPLKTCTECREAKPRTEFYRNTGRPDGLQSNCKPCRRETNRKWRAANPERHCAHVRKWAAANPEKVKANSAKQTARDTRRAHRYLRAFGYFERRQGWTDTVSRCLLAEKRLTQMCFMRPALEAHLAELV